MHIKLIFSLLFFILLTSCQTSTIKVAIPEVTKPIYDVEKAINDISIGMTKKQVINILGYPLSTEADYNLECLSYPLTTYSKETFSLLFNNNILIKYNKKQRCIELFKEY